MVVEVDGVHMLLENRVIDSLLKRIDSFELA